MKKIRVSITLGFILLLFNVFTNSVAIAKSGAKGIIEKYPAPFELKNGDRVVFIGNSLFENDQQYGYLEFALTSRWPDRDITFRNLGWSGDTVFGEARSYFTNPPSAYELLVEQLTNARPTIVFVAYGGNEAVEGEAGVPRFSQGLNQLLDKIEELGARTILFSPIPQMSTGNPENLSIRNKNLELYSSAIANTASERDLLFVDIFKPLQEISKNSNLSDEGVHLNETGYYYLASIMEEGLGLSPRNWSVNINVSELIAEATIPTKILNSDVDEGHIKFTVHDEFLPLPLPVHGLDRSENVRELKIRGLKRGYYSLTVDGAQVLTATAKKWSEGVEIKQGTPFTQSSQLRNRILKKNELFFHQYRPLNRTYIIGFRSYEQGRHLKGLEDLDIIIGWLEGQIGGVRMPKSNIYQLTPLK
ncbi:MAG: SGNH/GDSL hydrolase family protein [Anditalea sp.]